MKNNKAQNLILYFLKKIKAGSCILALFIFISIPSQLFALDATYSYKVGSWDEGLIYNTSEPTSYVKNIFSVPTSGIIDKIEVTANLIAGWSVSNENQDIILRLTLPGGNTFNIWSGDWPSSGEHEYTKTIYTVNGHQMAGTWKLTFTSYQARDNNLLIYNSDMFGLHNYSTYDDAFQRIKVKIYYLEDWPASSFNVKYYNKFNNFTGNPDAVENLPGLSFSYSNWDSNSPVIAGKRIGTWKDPDGFYQNRGAYNDFSIRYQSNPAFESANYYFSLQGDDKISLYLDETFIDSTDWSTGIKQVKRYMNSGSHKIRLDYFQGVGHAFTSFSFAKDQTPPASASINAPDVTSSPQIIASISATDFFGVTGYAINVDNSFPGSWATVAETENFSTILNVNIGNSEGAHTIYAWFKDRNGNTTGPVSRKIILDHSPPSGSIAIESGDGSYVNTQTISFRLNAHDNYSYVTHYAVSETNSLSNSSTANTWIAIPLNSSSFDIALNYTFKTAVNENKTIYVWIKDQAGLTAGPYSDSIILDTAAPYEYKINANSGATWAKDVSLTLNLHAKDSLSPIKYYFYSENPAPAAYLWKTTSGNLKNFDKNETYSLGINATDGLKIIYAWYKDAAGNVSPRSETNIVLDRTAPYEVSGKIIINDDYPYTISRNVNLKVNALDPNNATGYSGGVCGYYISESSSLPDLNDLKWKNFPPVANYINNSIPYAITGPEGIVTVYAYFKDAAGNISNVVSDTVELDFSSPVGSVKINYGKQFTNNNEMTINLTANDGGGITGFFISETRETAPALSDANWTKCPVIRNFSKNFPYKFAQTNGKKKINVWYRDGAGNISDRANAEIILDSAPPDPGTGEVEVVTIAGNGLASENNSVVSALAAPISGPAGICVTKSGDIYFTTAKNTIKKLRSDGIVETIAGSALTSGGKNNGYAPASTFDKPCGIIADASQNIFICDFNNNLIRQISSMTTYTSNFSGSASAGDSDGTAAGAAYFNPYFIQQANDGTFYLTDSKNKKVKKIYKDPGGYYMVSSVTGSVFNLPAGIAVTAANDIFVCDSGANLIRKISSAGELSTYAGAIDSGYADGNGINAKFNAPCGIAADKYGNIFISDSKNNLIRRISTDGASGTIAGDKTLTAGHADGPGQSAKFNSPAGIAVANNGTIYAADSKNNRIRKITPVKDRGLDINHGSKTAHEKNIVLSLAACDDYGISGYYISCSSGYKPPVSADSPADSALDGTPDKWHNLSNPVKLFTAEVNFTLDTCDDPRTIYVWYKDSAGNISITTSKDVNQKYMRIVSSHGVGYLNNPAALSSDSYSNLWVIDQGNPAIYKFKGDQPQTRFGAAAGTSIDTISHTLSGITVNSSDNLLLGEKDKSRYSCFITNEVTLNQPYFINSTEKSIFLTSNITDYSSFADLRNSVTDKYSGNLNYSAVRASFKNLTIASTQPEKNLKIRTIELYSSSDYSAASKISNLPRKQKLFISVKGMGGAPDALKSLAIEITSPASHEKLSFSLLETSIGSNKYKSDTSMSYFQIGDSTDLSQRIIAAKSGDYIIIKDLSGDYSQIFMVQ